MAKKSAPFSKAAQVERLAALRARQADIRAVVDPIAAELDAFVAEHGPKEREIRDRLLAARSGDELHQVEQEIAFLTRALAPRA